MQRKISKDLTLFYKDFFPTKLQLKKHYKYEITLGLGGNIGNTQKIFHTLFLYLKKDTRFNIFQTSPILKNPPFGYLEQNYFCNSLLILQTNIHPLSVLNIMQKYEKKFKRIRTFQDAPRTLDIDIIFIKKFATFIKMNHPRLVVPHPGHNKRESVFIPLTLLQ